MKLNNVFNSEYVIQNSSIDELSNQYSSSLGQVPFLLYSQNFMRLGSIPQIISSGVDPRILITLQETTGVELVSIIQNIYEKTQDVQLSAVDTESTLIVANTTGSARTLTVPALTSTEDKYTFLMVRSGSNSLTFAETGSYKIKYPNGTGSYNFDYDGDGAWVVYRNEDSTFYVFPSTNLPTFSGKLPDMYSPVALYHFDGNLSDQGSAMEDFIVTGSEIYTVVPSTGQRSLYLNGSTSMAAVANAATQLTGSYTVEMALRLEDWSGILITQGGLGETQAENTLFGTRITSGELSYIAEQGAGSNITYALSGYRVPLNTDFLLQEVRESNQVSWYINGQQIGASSSGLVAPDGGGSGWLSIGDIFGGSNHPKGVLHSLRIIPQSLTSAQLKSSARSIGIIV